MRLAKVLVVDDEADFRGTLRRGLERESYAVAEAADGAEALARLRAETYDLVIVDLYLPGMTGLALLEALRAAGGKVPPTIVITGLGDWGSYARALELGVKAYLTKPLGMAELSRAVARAMAASAEAGAGKASGRA